MKLSPEFKGLVGVNLAIAIYVAFQLRDLISLLIPPSPALNLQPNELVPITYERDPLTNVSLPDRPLIIPKIIHQTYKTVEVPDKWIKEQQSCVNFHGDYKYMFWTDESSRDFIKENYNWFLPTFDSYPYNIMRADVIRYFVLYHYGGVYIDLDNGCNRRMDPLLTVPAWFRKTDPTGISNDIMGSVPHHEFFSKTIENLQRYNINWLVSYITIMYSTGPLFLSVIWKQYLRTKITPGHDVRLLLPENGLSHASIFFYQVRGSSWHNGDARVIMMMNDHLVLSVIFCTGLAFSILFLEYKLIQLVLRSSIGNKLRSRMPRRAVNPSFFFRHVYATVRGTAKQGNDIIKSYIPFSGHTAAASNRSDESHIFFYEEDDSDNGEHPMFVNDEYIDEKAASRLNNLSNRPVSRAASAIVSTVSSVPVVGELFNKMFGNPLHHDDDNDDDMMYLKKGKRGGQASLLLPSYHSNSSSSSLNSAVVDDASLCQQSYAQHRVPVTSNVATPCPYDDHLLSPGKHTIDITTLSLSSTSTRSSSPVSPNQPALTPNFSPVGHASRNNTNITIHSAEQSSLSLPPPTLDSVMSGSSVSRSGSVSPEPLPHVGETHAKSQEDNDSTPSTE